MEFPHGLVCYFRKLDRIYWSVHGEDFVEEEEDNDLSTTKRKRYSEEKENDRKTK